MYKDKLDQPIPDIVVNAIRDAFPKRFDQIMSEIRHYPSDGFYGFNVCGIFVGCEYDGYIHS